VNAFAVPGGFVYVNRGLIERTTRMDQLAGVLGHEIGHIVKRHSVKQMQAAQRANTGLTLACILTRVCESGVAGAAVQIGGGALFAKFSRDDETEADQEGIRNVVRAGIDPRGIPAMFRILLAERNRGGSGSVDSWFATHPLEQDRIAATEAVITGIPRATLTRLTQDSPRYQAFKQRLASLPVSASRTR
jgi:beta-barrel assembly-enhancing protease